MFKLTICIPTFNRAEYLRQALQSVERNLEQVSANTAIVDLVVSDNASTDNTVYVVKEYQKRIPITYNLNRSNIGPAANLIRSVQCARGDYVWILADDDALTDGAIDYLLRFLGKYPDVDYIFYPRILADRNLVPRPNGVQPQGVVSDVIFEDGRSLFASFDGQMPGLLGFFSSTIIRRTAWEEAILNENGEFTEWAHLRIILRAIRDRRCAILGKAGVLCRLENSRPFHVNSKVWFDDYIKTFILAKELGYSPTICDQTIQRIVDHAQKSFVLDKMHGKRFDSIPACLSQLGITKLVRSRSLWIWLSCLPVRILRLGLPLYYLRKTLMMGQ
jgi:glycosyltransferase involved in cell wall biosynthesis